ncbi:HAD-like protein [Dendrothele bispora CBS 962.96]|uniref:HAD-like protein n=1 Tax=Dendrothele bispora (strain CBS 962.96) TaxID=1314807 RepID=A0A4S8MK99_DENBC|nr:HAD-like protein [Dendrothele bispora CBS 962.96]
MDSSAWIVSFTFFADAILFDMDGTLTDSIQAVEAAWGKVAQEIGQDPAKVIAATHGKRAIDNLAQLKPHIKPGKMDNEVAKFEESILYFADAYNLHGPGSSCGSSTPNSTCGSSDPPTSASSSNPDTPSLTPDTGRSSTSSSRRSSVVSPPESRRSSVSSSGSRRSSFAKKLSTKLIHLMNSSKNKAWQVFQGDESLEQWQIEAASVDRSVRILPGVKKMIDSLPEGRYAVATSGAKTYAYGCMNRVGITPPPVTITADDKRLKAGKPAPDPFLLAAKCLGYDASNCVVFEDSPSGIRAGVASGATVIAVCTSHTRSQIENCGAHFIVENMESVQCEVEDERLKITVSLL